MTVTDPSNLTLRRQTVTVIVDGANDGPTFTGGTTTGVVNEQLFVTNADPKTVADNTTGTLNFTDPDLIDTHTAPAGYVANTAAWSGGDTSLIPAQTLTDLASAMQAQVTADSINGATGQVTWTATLPDRDLDFLGQGETLTATFNVLQGRRWPRRQRDPPGRGT